MSYKIKEELIHDREAMWNIALMFKCHYSFIKEQIERVENNNEMSILVDGKVVMKWDENFQSAFKKYKEEFHFMNDMLEFELKMENSILTKYIIKV